MHMDQGSSRRLVLLLVVVGLISAIGIPAGVLTVRQEILPVRATETCTVTDVIGSGGGATVLSEDCGTLRVASEPLITFDEADALAATIAPGMTYQFETQGDRIEWLGYVPRIIAARSQ